MPPIVLELLKAFAVWCWSRKCWRYLPRYGTTSRYSVEVEVTHAQRPETPIPEPFILTDKELHAPQSDERQR